MTATLAPCADHGQLQCATFAIGDLLLGIDIHQVREINRNTGITPVPHAPPAVRGVINLRGEVVTVIDLRRVLGLPPAELTRSSRTVVVNHGAERIGFLVDAIADVITAENAEIDPLPENLSGVDQSFFQGVFKLEQGLLVILNVDEALAAVGGASES
jgi:purine-binding chemotaxis protein CheW